MGQVIDYKAIKPIQTKFNGRLFRSRLEARWAVFFKALGINYEYEKEGFDLDGTWYLPDFYLPRIDTWIEIKPGLPDDWPDHIVFEYFENNSCEPWEGIHPFKNFVLIVGQPSINIKDGFSSCFGYNGIVFGDQNYRWCECPDCGLIGLEFDGRSDRLPCKSCIQCDNIINHYGELQKVWHFDSDFKLEYAGGIRAPYGFGHDLCPYHPEKPKLGCPRHANNKDKTYNYDTIKLISAYEAAMSARF